jgi:hypothetical protein
MAGFADLVRDMVALADDITGTLQVEIQHYTWSAATVDSYGKTTWGTPVNRQCVVEKTSRLVRNDQGDLVQAIASITFPRPVTLDVRDKFVLPDGLTGPIIKVNGVVDPGTDAVYALEVMLGQG